MLTEIYEIIKPELATLVITVLTAIMSYIGHQIKKLYEESCKDDKVRKIIQTVVTAVEEIYANLNVDEKFEKSVENISKMLTEKKILVTDLELKLLVKEAVHCCKKKENII